MIGESAVMRGLRARIARIAIFDSHVLITGETGTGKELAARAIHSHSRRSGKVFVAVNCAAIPDALVEGELFGWERGAYTGAVQSFAGRLALAEGGSILLDEIGEMSPSLQAKLLRAIETHEVYRVGGVKAVRFDVRVIAATNQDVERDMERERFRRDLYFRLAVARVHLPALRDRVEDVPVLLRHFVDECNRCYGRHARGFAPEVVERLMRYDWPGNVRELRNLVEACFIECQRDEFGLADLPEPWPATLDAVAFKGDERQRIIAALNVTSGNKTAAAGLLQVSRMTLYRKLKRYELARKLFSIVTFVTSTPLM
jgi:transcriptional regulator with PAS, ATPase and Fis domain